MDGQTTLLDNAMRMLLQLLTAWKNSAEKTGNGKNSQMDQTLSQDPIVERRLASADGALISIIATDLLALPLTTAGTDSEGENPFGGSGWSRLTQSPFEAWVPPQTAERLGVVEG